MLKNIRFISQRQANEFVFFVIYGIWLFLSIMSLSFYYVYFYQYYPVIIAACIMVLFAGEFVYGRFKLKDIISCAVLLIVAVLLIRYNVMTLYTLILFVFFSRNIKFEKIAKITEIMSLLTVIFIISSSYLGIIRNYVSRDDILRVRESIGFRYPLYPAAFACNIITMFLCADKDNIKWKKIFLYSALCIWVYLKTKSRLSFIISVIIILYAVYIKLKGYNIKNNKIICYALVSSFVVLFALSLYISINYQPSVPLYKNLNLILSGRLSLQNSAINNYGMSAFGKNIAQNGWALDMNGKNMTGQGGHIYNYIDNLYLQLLVIRGWIFTVLVVALFTYVSYKVYKEHRYVLLFALASLAIRFFVDDLALQLCYNGLWFAVAKYIFSNSYEEKNNAVVNSKTQSQL